MLSSPDPESMLLSLSWDASVATRVCGRPGDGGLVAKSCTTLVTPCTTGSQAPLSMDFPGKNTGVGCHFLLQRIFPTQGSNSHLLHWRVDSLLLSHEGSRGCSARVPRAIIPGSHCVFNASDYCILGDKSFNIPICCNSPVSLHWLPDYNAC